MYIILKKILKTDTKLFSILFTAPLKLMSEMEGKRRARRKLGVLRHFFECLWNPTGDFTSSY